MDIPVQGHQGVGRGGRGLNSLLICMAAAQERKYGYERTNETLEFRRFERKKMQWLLLPR